MILESKQDKSKGCQITNTIQFEDYVILKNKKQTFKLALEADGITLYQEQGNKSWTKVDKQNTALLDHLKQREIETSTHLEQLQARIALEQSKTANIVSLLKVIQEQMKTHTKQLKELTTQVASFNTATEP